MRARVVQQLIAITSLFGQVVIAQTDPPSRPFDTDPFKLFPPAERFERRAAMQEDLATDSNFTVLGRWAWGSCQAVDVQGGYAYIGNGPTFHVLDVSDPQTPFIVGEYVADEIIYDIKLRESLAYVATEATLLILNVADPQQPLRVSELFISSGPIRVAPVDSLVFVATYLGSLRIVDVSNPATPFFRGSIGAGGERPWCLAAKGRFAYVGNLDFPDLAIVNATNPDAPTRTFLNVGGHGLSAWIRDTLLFLGKAPSPALRIYSITNPATPVLLGQTSLPPALINAVSAGENAAYVSTTDSGMVTVDISDLQQPQIRGRYRRPLYAPGNFTALVPTGTTVYAAYYNGLRVLNVSDIDRPDERAFFPTGGIAEKVFLRDSLAYVASGYAGLWILDVSDPTQPRPVSNILTGGGYATDVVVADSFAYLVNWVYYPPEDTTRGLWVMNVADAHQPSVLSHYAGIVRATQVLTRCRLAVDSNLVLMTQPSNSAYDSTLEVIDVSIPSSPQRKSIIRSQYRIHDIDAHAGSAFVARSDSGVRIFDIRIPESPILLSTALSTARGVLVSDTILYADRTDTLFAINISNPSQPAIAGGGPGYPFSASPRDLAVSERSVYSSESRLVGFDIANPSNPMMIAMFHKRFSRGGVDAKEQKVILCDGPFGITLLQNDFLVSVRLEPQIGTSRPPVLHQSFPNPSNPIAAITYWLPEAMRVDLSVYDILGRVVSNLVDDYQEQGLHVVLWDGKEFASGVYFCRLLSGNTAQNRKLILIR